MKRASLVVSFILTLTLIPAVLTARPKQVTILHFNDFHGHLEAEEVDGVEYGGAARIATLVKEIEAANNARGVENPGDVSRHRTY